jgi:pilus assembly protein CpaE
VSRKDFEGSIERKVDVVLPFDAKTAGRAAKLGQPLANSRRAPSSPSPSTSCSS